MEKKIRFDLNYLMSRYRAIEGGGLYTKIRGGVFLAVMITLPVIWPGLISSGNTLLLAIAYLFVEIILLLFKVNKKMDVIFEAIVFSNIREVDENEEDDRL